MKFRHFSSVSRAVQKFDVVVVGGGHAGCEAAAAAARTGAKTALITQKLDTIGEMSCNPSMGGIGKGHLIREIDALDGVMGRITDKAGIQFKVLNASRGPAVRGPRAQCDREMYKVNMRKEMEETPNLTLIEDSVDDLVMKETSHDSVLSCDTLSKDDTITSMNSDDLGYEVAGVKTGSGTTVAGKTVVITTGTFLRGMIHIGLEKYPAGRHKRDSAEVEPPSVGLALTLENLQFPMSRLTTGTPPRICGNTIDYDELDIQPSDDPPVPLSFINWDKGVANASDLVVCHRTFTNQTTHDIVRDHSHLLPKFTANEGKGVGPRYCPSIEKKIIRFPDKTRHQIWLEPEGLDTSTVYPNGINTALPPDEQVMMLRSIKGLENVKMIRPGYAVEYDFIDPRSLHASLETRKCKGLFFAGQINGTTGYEEAGAQGVIAGINAGRSALASSPLILDRTDAFIGVLIDDLITMGAPEPYRMFTSRSEYRLSLRVDNADLRLTEKGAEYGVVSEERLALVREKKSQVEKGNKILRNFELTAHKWSKNGIRMAQDGKRRSALDVLEFPHITLSEIETIIENNSAEEVGRVHPIARTQVEVDAKYKSYLDQQRLDMEAYKKDIDKRIPDNFDYSPLPRLSSEEIAKLNAAKPVTLNAASRVEGIRPSTLLYLHQHFKMLSKKEKHEKKSVSDGS